MTPRGETLHLVIYDISSDKVRKKVADQLLDLGLVRAQYSVFIGTANQNRIDEITLFAEEHLSAKDRLYVIPISQDGLSESRQIGPGIDEELVTGEALTRII